MSITMEPRDRVFTSELKPQDLVTSEIANIVGDFSSEPRVNVDRIEGLPVALVRAYVDAAIAHAWVREIEAGQWFAEVKGLQGVWGDGETVDEAISQLSEAIVSWVALKRVRGVEIPPIEGLDLNVPRRG